MVVFGQKKKGRLWKAGVTHYQMMTLGPLKSQEEVIDKISNYQADTKMDENIDDGVRPTVTESNEH